MKAWQFWTLVAVLAGLGMVQVWSTTVTLKVERQLVQAVDADTTTVNISPAQVTVKLEPVISILEQQNQAQQEFWNQFAACLCEYTSNPWKGLLAPYKEN